MKRYQAPEKQWLSGHRGIDLNVEEGEELLAPADGMIAFAGSVAGCLHWGLKGADRGYTDPEGKVRAVTIALKPDG